MVTSKDLAPANCVVGCRATSGSVSQTKQWDGVRSEILPTQWMLGGQARLWLAADRAAAREIAAAAVVAAELVVE